MSLIVTFDGPKAVGKTTLIQRVCERLKNEGHYVSIQVEKELLPEEVKKALVPLYEQMRAAPCPANDQAIADALLAGRIRITSQLRSTPLADIVLLDRWYPSETVFRRYLRSDVLVLSNLTAGVLVPDLIVALLCAPQISWKRAHQRGRSLDSKVISDFEAHTWSTENFRKAALEFGWMLIESDILSPAELSIRVCNTIVSKLVARVI